MTNQNKKSGFLSFLGIPNWVSIPLMIISVLGLIVQCSINYNTKQMEKSKAHRTSETQIKNVGKKPRRAECERNHSIPYCDCTMNHVGKSLGFVEEVEWLNGGQLTSANGRKAALEAVTLCSGL